MMGREKTQTLVEAEMNKIAISAGKTAIISPEDFDRVSKFRWTHGSSGCAYRQFTKNNKMVAVYMSRFILNIEDPSILVDHINGDRLDNRRENLRPCTKQQNGCNQRKRSRPASSKYKGVSWDKSKGKWEANINFCGSKFHLGRFLDEESAARAYNLAAKRLHGEYAKLNQVIR